MPNVKGDGHDSDTGVEREMYSCIAPVPSHNMLQWGLVPCVKVRIDDQTHNYNQQSIARERQTYSRAGKVMEQRGLGTQGGHHLVYRGGHNIVNT